MRKFMVFVSLLTVICLTSAAFAVEMKRIGEEGTPATATPGITGTVEIEYLTLDISCFLDDKPVKVEVIVVEIDSEGNFVYENRQEEWSEDGRARFSVLPRKSYRILANKKSGPSSFIMTASASQDIINLIHSTAVGLALERL